jgi:3-phosphoshikimate 1-carboxyvinyltransferase
MPSEVVSGPGKFQGLFVPPGDKSISHRAVMFGALAEGESSFSHFLEAEDCLSTVKAFQSMGVDVTLEKGRGLIRIKGVGLNGLQRPDHLLDMGNSGTTTRLLLGILAGQKFEVTLAGDASLSARPMRRVTDPLKKMGAQIKGGDKGNFLPLSIRGGKLTGIDFDNRLSSAQVKSALLLAGLYADGPTRVREAVPSRDHTEKFLSAANAPFRKEGDSLVVEKAEKLMPVCGEIPGDMSAAAFFLVGAAMVPGSELEIKSVCLNRTRTGVLEVLKRMGARISVTLKSEIPEPIGDIRIEGARLKGTRVRRDEIPSLIDELPILMVAMALAEGESMISGAEELRVKETDRILSMVSNLKTVGAQIDELPDGCIIRGVEVLSGGITESRGDHRTAMSMAIASLACPTEIRIADTGCIATSFPSFFSEFHRLKTAK